MNVLRAVDSTRGSTSPALASRKLKEALRNRDIIDGGLPEETIESEVEDPKAAEQAPIVYERDLVRTLSVATPRVRGLLDLLFMVILGINEGMLIGYIGSLTAIFTERKVPAYLRSCLNFTMSPLILRVLISPIVDRHYFEKFGKRKTYIIPFKLLAGIFYMCLSFFIEDMVENEEVIKISMSFFFLCILLCFENNAIVGLRREYFGRENPGYIGASHNMAVLLGITIGMQMFTALNSRRICRTYLGLSGKLLSHRVYMLTAAGINIMSNAIFLYIREDDSPDDTWPVRANVVVIFKSIFVQPLVRKLLLLQMFIPMTVMCMKAVSMQYYISKGVSREHVILLSLILIPIMIIANISWIPFTRTGGLMKKTWLICSISVLVELLHIPNLMFFNKENYPRTMVGLGLIYCLEICCPWTMFQSAVINMTASRKYASSYICAFSSLLSSSRYIVLYLVNPFIDTLTILFTFGLLSTLQIAANVYLFSSADELDEHNKEEFKMQFERAVDGNRGANRRSTV